MQSVLRVGAISGVVGCIALYGLARTSGLVAAYGIIVLGFATGLAMAKWLDWSWYGRQLEAGAQAGAIACVPAAALTLVALLAQNAHSVAALETASHLGPVNAAGLARAFGFAGWAGADILSIIFSTLFAIGVAALTSIIMAWSKSGRAVRSVNQAYEAARALRSGAWNPAGATMVPAIQGATAAIPAWPGAQGTTAGLGENGLAWSGTQQTAAIPAPPPGTYGPVSPAALQGVPAHTLPGQGDPHSGKPSANNPANDDELRAAMREALAMWGDESGEHEMPPAANPGAKNGNSPSASGEPGKSRKRSPQASQFLNDSKKRGRKKADTRDWLC